MDINIKWLLLIAAILLMVITPGEEVKATEYYSVAAGSQIQVDEWSKCYLVTNSGGSPKAFIPTKTENEWVSFIDNHPAHLSLTDCPAGLPLDAKVTWYEQSGGIGKFTWYLSELPQSLSNCSGEHFTISLVEGKYIKSACYRKSQKGVGHNVVAIRINLPSDNYATNYWANGIVSYVMGTSGIAASRPNVLGSDTKLGPYDDQKCAYLGNDNSEIVVKFAVP